MGGVTKPGSFFPLVLPILLLAGVPGCGGEVDSRREGSDAFRVDRPSFDGQAAYDLVATQVGFGPRVPGWEGHDRQLEWMEGLLREWADTLHLLPFQYLTSGGENLHLTNILARFRPEATHRILLLTHWDTRPWSDRASNPELRDTPVPGANDGASGTAVLLHLASLLSESAPPSGIDLLFIDGEDYGPDVEDMFMGSRHFAQSMAGYGSWTYGLLLDMVGDREPLFPVEAYSAEFAPAVVQRVWRIADDLGYRDYFPNRVGARVSDDHVYFNQAGLPTVDVIDFEYGPGDVQGGRYWHTPDDDLENVSAETLGMVGEVVAELVYRGG